MLDENKFSSKNTIVATKDIKRKENNRRMLIGRPIWNTQIYILDNQNQLVPIGVVGEICVCGEGLAAGYLNSSNQTKDKFIPNPYKPDELMYKTGDLGKWHFDGSIEYIGRRDTQIKIKGHRIELKEVEDCILNLSNVKEVTVTIQHEINEEPQMVAFVTLNEREENFQFPKHLKEFLPYYMIPTKYIILDSMPINPNGKIDRVYLDSIKGRESIPDRVCIAPRTRIEQMILEIWEEVLKRNNISVDDDFFELGGHSLSATMILAKILDRMGVQIGMEYFFINSSIEQLASQVQFFLTQKEIGFNKDELKDIGEL